MLLFENLKIFFESSTIHGLVYWSTTSRLVKLFWIIVVITGFSVAGMLIQTSFKDWQESPIKTTVETVPISEVAFPKINVCPAKDTYTNLNYDLMMMEQNGTRIFTDDEAYDLRNNFIRHFQQLEFENLGKPSN